MSNRTGKDTQESILVYRSGYLAAALSLLVLFSIVAIISGVGTYRISIEGSTHLLETRAIDIAVNIGFTLERLGIRNDLFPELVTKDTYENLAFLALYDEDGTILLHSNPSLVGRKETDPDVAKVLRLKKPDFHFSTLATGEKVFILDFPLHLHLSDKSVLQFHFQGEDSEREIKRVQSAKNFCLRVALHTYPAEKIVRRANFQLILICASLLILWGLAFFFVQAWRRNARLEAKLREQERMAMLGRMAAVLAHEIRNPLSSIKGFAQIHAETADSEDLKEDLNIIIEETKRLERLTTNLLVYARPAVLNEVEFRVKDFCQDVQRLLLSEEGRCDKVVLDCSERIVCLDRGKLMQIVLNLVQNAIDAIKDKEQGRVWLTMKVAGGKMKLVVEDNGPGLPEGLQAKMFEPFFTTKTKGTGLGLAIVKRLVDAMNGRILVRKRSGGGTVMEVVFPYKLRC